jgi:translation initiation factor 3 subunit L
MVHIAESTVGRRYAGWFIKNTERTQKLYDDLKNQPLPPAPKSVAAGAAAAASAAAVPDARAAKTGPAKVAWGGVKVA